MPYYKKRVALSPLNSEIITRSRAERLLELSVQGFSTPLNRLNMSIRQEAVEDYKDFYVPRSIAFSGGGGDNKPTYCLSLLNDEIDARVVYYSEKKSPWLRNDSPSLSEIEACWLPLTDADMQREMEKLFLAVEEHALAHHYAGLPDEHKLSVVKREDIDLVSLVNFCSILGQNTEQTIKWTEDHVQFAAFNPHNYLKTNNLLAQLTLDSCRHFSWRNLIFDNDTHFYNNGYFAIEDWKTEAADMEYGIRELLTVTRPDDHISFSLTADENNYLASYWFCLAAKELEKHGLYIVFLDDAGDGFLYTLADWKTAHRLAGLGNKIGLQTEILLPVRPGWRTRMKIFLEKHSPGRYQTFT